MKDEKTEEPAAVVDEVDIAIIGAGLSGIYTAMRLRQLYPSSNIVVYERWELSAADDARHWMASLDFGSGSRMRST